MKTYLIINPTAGRGKALKLVPKIEARLKELGLAYTLRISESPSAPPDLARQAVEEGYELIVAGGGDGTNQAVASALRNTSAVLGILPLGRGNDLAHGLGIPTDPLAACQVLQDGRPMAIDLGLASNGKVFLNVAGAGFDAEVTRYANRIRWFKGNFVYLLAIFVKLVSFRPARFTLEHDGGTWQGKAMMVAVANSRYYGGGLFVAPQARPDDGLLDVVIIGDLSRLEFVRAFPTVYRGTHIHHPKVQVFRTKRISIASEAPFCSYADGDFLGDLPISLEAQPQAIRILVPGTETV
jgi:diacylglycerol kinase (ATP)